MQVAVPNKLRIALYILTGAAAPVVGYLNAKGIIDADGVALFQAEVAFASAVAAFKAVDFRRVDRQTEVADREPGVVEITESSVPKFEHLG